jgi:hypothetical protein
LHARPCATFRSLHVAGPGSGCSLAPAGSSDGPVPLLHCFSTAMLVLRGRMSGHRRAGNGRCARATRTSGPQPAAAAAAPTDETGIRSLQLRPFSQPTRARKSQVMLVPRIWLTAGAMLPVALVWLACGGKVAVGIAPQGDHSGAGGTVSSEAEAGAAERAVPLARPQCPEQEPQAGTDCTPEGIVCSYGSSVSSLCRATYTCSGYSWMVASEGPCVEPPEGSPFKVPRM